MPNTNDVQAIEQQIRKLAKTEEYMSDQQLLLFRNLLEILYKNTVTQIHEAKEEITKPTDEADVIDNASIEAEMILKLKIIDRQTKLLGKIDEAITMIEQKTYGYCIETGEPIGIERLLLRPTANLSVDAKSIKEEEEKDYGSATDEE